MSQKRRRIVVSSDEDTDGEQVPERATSHRAKAGASDTSASASTAATAATGEAKTKKKTKNKPALCGSPPRAHQTPRVQHLGELMRRRRAPSKSWLAEARTRCVSRVGVTDSITKSLVKKAFLAVDDEFLGGCVGRVLEGEKRTLRFAVSNRMTSRAGQLSTERATPNKHELSVAAELIDNQRFVKGRPVEVNGIVCANKIEVLLRVSLACDRITFAHHACLLLAVLVSVSRRDTVFYRPLSNTL